MVVFGVALVLVVFVVWVTGCRFVVCDLCSSFILPI